MNRTDNLHFFYKNPKRKHRNLFSRAKKRASKLNKPDFLSEEEVIAAIWGSGFSGSSTLLRVFDLSQSNRKSL
ncbi:MAG TPA: hypothetical protein VN370_09665 [Desulfitobacteriaceae bacterium]|nr:hypothetical protein [Desulfitobacteriaceae bacterium]